MIKAIVFDCFGVFYIDPILGYVTDPDSPPEKAKALHELDKQLVADLITENEFLEQATELLGLSSSEIRRKFFVPSARNQPLLKYAEELKKKYKVGMLSNVSSSMMDDYFTLNERKELFDAVVLSGDVGLAKPDPRIFELICDKLNVTTSEAVMIDDLPDFCESARNTGMQAIVFTSTARLKTELNAILFA